MTHPDRPENWPEPAFVPYLAGRRPDADMIDRGRTWHRQMATRRSIRAFSPDSVPRECLELAIRTASTAPSGANLQPWRFVAVSDPAVKRQIREAAEAEERESYLGGRMPEEWLRELAPLGTIWEKPYLETAPWLVVLFEEVYGLWPDGQARKHYYVRESAGIACGIFLAALHEMGLASLVHTPSPMGFLRRILGRPENERPFALIPVGHPAPDAVVPDLRRKVLAEVSIFIEG